MDIKAFQELMWQGKPGTFTVNLTNEWEISQVAWTEGFQVGVGNVALISLSCEGVHVDRDILDERVLQAVSDFYYGEICGSDGTPRYFGSWVEDKNGDASLWLDKSVWVADQLSANIVGAVLGEKEIYDWENDKCLPVIPAGK